METTHLQEKPAASGYLGSRRGFTLIEMAIVLVIIGIIIGAIVKGQDLIANAHAKKVISAVSTWRNLTVTFLDRNGRFPGDLNGNGIIGDQLTAVASATSLATVTEQTAAASAIAELSPVMQTTPDNPVVVGSSSFWVYIGSIVTATPVTRNAILVCGTVDCATAFTPEQLEIIKAMDTAYDGIADSGLGQFRSVTTAPTLAPVAPALASGRMSASFSGAGVAATVDTNTGTATPWPATAVAAVWLFDKPF
jgi:prepilin-type N-terminal cleavage/methylation domain-containing protein